MSSKSPPTSKEERLAKALRENLARRKALVRAKRQRSGTGGTPSANRGRGAATSSDDESS